MLSNSLGVPLAPEAIILSTMACHPARFCRGATERAYSWHWAQMRSASALPGTSCANAPAAKKTTAAKVFRVMECIIPSLVLDREAEAVERAVMRAEVDLAGGAGESA